MAGVDLRRRTAGSFAGDPRGRKILFGVEGARLDPVVRSRLLDEAQSVYTRAQVLFALLDDRHTDFAHLFGDALQLRPGAALDWLTENLDWAGTHGDAQWLAPAFVHPDREVRLRALTLAPLLGGAAHRPTPANPVASGPVGPATGGARPPS